MINKLKEFDLYRRIPKDLTEASTHGSILSICASIFMLVLFVAELWAFLSTQTTTNIVIDSHSDNLLQINFNITVLDMPCEYATIDVIDVLGTRENNVTKNVLKWQIDENGIRQGYHGHNVEQPDLLHDVHHDLEELHANGMHATPVNAENFDNWLHQHHYVFVNFYAPWCIWCQRLEPVWEAFAEKAQHDEIPVSIIKVDCVENGELCQSHKIQAFPMLRLFRNSEVQPPDYRSDRTVEALIAFLHERIGEDKHVDAMMPHEKAAHEERKAYSRTDHPGCLLAGILLVNRVPGNFHIEARSKHHNINPTVANLSHVVNELSFGPTINDYLWNKLDSIPENFFSKKSINPMNDKFYVNDELHRAFHHYLKVVTTQVEASSRYVGDNAILAYQMIASSQVMLYAEEDTPEARFAYDISPMSVIISRKGKHWYEFITSICALIGGTFTVVGLLSGFLNIIFKPKKL